MRSTIRRFMTTIVVDLMVVASAAGPGWALVVTPARPACAPRELDPRPDRPPRP